MEQERRRRSTGKVDRLPPELKDTVEQMLLTGCTYKEIVAFLKANGEEMSQMAICTYEEQMKEVPIEKLIKETNGLIRAAAYKKRIEVQNKENYEAGLEAVQSMVFETMAKDDPELYHRVSAYLNKKKSEGMEG